MDTTDKEKQSLFPLANEEQQKAGWKYSCGFLQDIEEAVEKSGESISAEAAESVLDYLDTTLSGKTGYDQVEVERERLRKAVTNEIAELERQVKGLAESPLMQFAAKDFERQAYEIGLLSGKCQWFLSLLSSPVSGEGKPTEI